MVISIILNLKKNRRRQNAAKLIEKYNDLAREALSNGDKILSENYLQHSDHFARILNSQEAAKIVNLETNNSIENKINQKTDEVIPTNGNEENNLEAAD